MPGSWTGRTYPDLDVYEEIARISERGCIDMLFFGDGTGIPDTWQGSRDEAVRWGIGWPRHDMSPVITAMSRVTKHVGFGLTYASTFMHPFYVARLFNHWTTSPTVASPSTLLLAAAVPTPRTTASTS